MREIVRRILYFLRRRKLENELREEIELHRELTRQALEANGVRGDRVAGDTQRALGNDVLARDRARDVWVSPWLQDIAQDVRFAVRLLLKDRRFTLAAVVALALGIGVTNTVFTIINAAILRDLPFDAPHQLISLSTRTADGRDSGVSGPDFRDWQQATIARAELGASTMAAMTLAGEGRQPERLRGTFVSTNLFGLLRVAPILGRDFVADDDRPGTPPVVIISYGVWQVVYGGDPTIVGRAVRINDIPATVIGVMPQRFGFPAFQALWQPLSQMPGAQTMARDARRLAVVGRLTDGTSVTQVRAVMDTVAAQLAHDHPGTNRDTAASVTLLGDRRPDARGILTTMVWAVAFVLLIACANVANLLLARSVTRAREIAIRASLGATRWRIVRQLLVECVSIATIAGALGMLLSVYGVKLLGVAFDVIEIANPIQSNTPYWVDLSMNMPVFIFVAALCLATGLIFGLVPALHISKTDVNRTLKDGGRGGLGGRSAQRWTGAFVVAELAMTLVLLTAAGLLWRSFLTSYRADVVVDAADLVTMRVALPTTKYATPEQVHRFYAQLDDRLAARGDAFRATIGGYLPYSSFTSAFLSTPPQRQVAIDGRRPAGERLPTTVYAFVGPRYFATIGLPVSHGRGFGDGDARAGQEAAIVDRGFATTFFGDEEPLGRRIQLSPATPSAGPEASAPPQPWLTIVGVVPTLRQFGPAQNQQPVVFVPLDLEPAPRGAGIVVRRTAAAEGPGRRRPIASDPLFSSIVSAVREEVRALDPSLPVFAIEPMTAALERSRVSDRLFGIWFGMLAVIALVLAAVGLYALTAHSVASRTQEIGVRMALGARGPEVVWLFVRRAAAQLALGLTLGIAGALGAGQLLHSMLTRTNPRDLATLALVSAVLVIVAIAACVIPARRAARLDPVVALRTE